MNSARREEETVGEIPELKPLYHDVLDLLFPLESITGNNKGRPNALGELQRV
jgi:hypothetical protein